MARRDRKRTTTTEDLLAPLVLWRHDPEQAEEISREAHGGHRDAQYALGLLYAEGRGVNQDEVEAYVWLSRAMQQGDDDAQLLRQIVQQNMSFDQISLAERRLAAQPLQT